MKFIKGFIIGAVAGFSVGNAISEQQRREIVAKVKRQTQPVGSAVADSAQEIADRATAQVAESVDQAGDSLADKVGDDSTVVTASDRRAP